MRKITFEEVASEWLMLHSANIKPVTYLMYEQKVKQLIKLFGSKKIADICYNNLQEEINKMFQKGLAKSTIQKTKITIGQIFTYAQRTNVIKSNPSQFLSVPRQATALRRKGLNDEHIAIIINNANKPFGLYALMMLLLGLRRSELLGLRYEDIDLKKKSIYVHRVVNFCGNVPTLYDGLKNKNSHRYVTIPDRLVDIIEHQKTLHKSGYVFNKDGNLLIQSQLNDLWLEYKERSGLVATQHMIRHTYASLLYRSEVDIKTAQYLMGHNDVHTTLQIYTHLSEEQKCKNIDKFNQYLSNKF